jgi:flavin reductase
MSLSGDDREMFRDALCRLGAAVNIITTDGPCGRHGLTASSVCSVSDDPPTVLVCVNRASASHHGLVSNGVLCVNILAGRHEQLSNRFGMRGMAASQRFAGAEWKHMVTGSPALIGAVANLDCEISDVKVVGTHSVLFCAVRGIELGREPESLIYFNRTYHRLGLAAAGSCRLATAAGAPSLEAESSA